MLHPTLVRARRAALLSCASTAVLAAAVVPTHAEQQIFNFFVNGGAFYDVTGASTGSSTGCCYSYVGPGTNSSPGHIDTPHNSHPAVTFATTSSGNGAISEAHAKLNNVGTKGHAVAGLKASDAYDGYGGIGIVGANNFKGLTVTRNTQVTHGPTTAVITPITNAFTNAGVPNATRWVETITNNTGSTISGTFGFFNNLGSDNRTLWVATNNGAMSPTSPHSATGNLWLTSIQNGGGGSEPVDTHILGNNTYTKTQVLALTQFGGTYANGNDLPAWLYPISVAPGQTQTIVLFSVLTADINYNPSVAPDNGASVASDIALGGQLANLITNNGNPISAGSPFFTGLTLAQLQSIINFSFVGLTIDTSQPFFTENDFAAQQNPSIFDGGTLKPTTAFTFNQPFVVHALGGTIDNSNGNLIFNGAFSDVGPLNFTGANATTLTAASPGYTGAVTVNGGGLFVTGDISAASGVTVNSGGTLGGTGMVASTTVNAGGVLMPGLGNGTTGALTIKGSLVLTSAATYLITIKGASNTLTNVTGPAALNGAGVVLTNDSQVNLGSKYTILTAAGGGLGGANVFNRTVNFGIYTGFLSYDPNDVFLTLGFSKLIPLLPPGASTNVVNVATAIDEFTTRGGMLPAGFRNLFNLMPQQLVGALNMLSGQAATDAIRGDVLLMNSFMELLTGPTGSNSSGAALPFAPERVDTFPSDVAQAYASVLKAPVYKAPAFEQRWSAWGTAFGGGNTTRGDAGVGSNDVSAHDGGFAAGIDYRLAPDTKVGIALAGGSTSWSLSAGLGGGHGDVFLAGLYGSKVWGPAYVSGALTYASSWLSTSRMSNVAGPDTLNASFNAQSFGGRLESGYRISSWAPVDVMPYAAVQAQSFHTPTYAETGALGVADPFALTFGAQTATVVRTELGSRFDHIFAQAGGSSLDVFGRAAWAHDWQSNPNLSATFIGLPAATFVVNGAKPPSNLALLTAGSEWRSRYGWSFMAKLNGEFANGFTTYASTAQVKYSW